MKHYIFTLYFNDLFICNESVEAKSETTARKRIRERLKARYPQNHSLCQLKDCRVKQDAFMQREAMKVIGVIQQYLKTA